MNFFIVYVALPALFYRIVAQDAAGAARATSLRGRRPRCRPSSPSRCPSRSRMALPRGRIARGDHRRARRRLRQYRLHGPGPGALDARAAGGGAGGADLLLRHAAAVLAGAVPDGAGRAASRWASVATAVEVVRRSSLHPFMIATALGVAVGGAAFRAAGGARPADAVPAERGGALRAVHARRHRGAAAAAEACRGRCRSLMAVKLVLHPLIVFVLLSLFGPFERSLDLYRGADGGAAAGAQCVRVRAPIRRLGRAGLERGADRHAGLGGHADQRDVAGEDRHCR